LLPERALKIPAITVNVCIAFLVSAASSQTPPALHQRAETQQQTQTRAIKGFSTLPEEASGEYELDDHGSVVQITVEQNRLTGYVTKMEQKTALTLFFDTTTIDGDRLSFTTKTVHGMRYSFVGKIVRGSAATSSETGFYRLIGNWTTYLDNARETEGVSLKSTSRSP
jgi:hypothetical protein